MLRTERKNDLLDGKRREEGDKLTAPKESFGQSRLQRDANEV
jgi:hypothetical protein